MPALHCGWTRRALQDRKSTRLNSSHLGISYAVFCLKKKKTRERTISALAGRAPRGLGVNPGEDLAAPALRMAAHRNQRLPRVLRYRGQPLSDGTVRYDIAPSYRLSDAAAEQLLVTTSNAYPRYPITVPDQNTYHPYYERLVLRYRIPTSFLLYFFFLNDRAPPEFSPLPLPDAFPI